MSKQLPTTADRQLPMQLSKQEPPQAFLERGFRREHWNVITQQLFPECRNPDTIVLLLDYCKVRNFDPMQKVFHIVPMKRNGEDCDTILPGVAYYEIVAHRTGQFAGKLPAEFGPSKKHVFKEQKWSQGGYQPTGRELIVDAPEWCRVAVKKIVGGQVCEFWSDQIFYSEFVALAKSTGYPNDNWRNKPRMMMGKCALAAALRVAFPEEVGNEPTAEEMEGREVYTDDAEPAPEGVKDLRQDPATQALASAGQRRRQTAAKKEELPPPPTTTEVVTAEVTEVAEEKLKTQAEVAAEKAASNDDVLITPEDWARILVAGQPNGWMSIDLERLACKKFSLPAEDAKCVTNKQGRQLGAMVTKYQPAFLLPEFYKKEDEAQ